MESGVPGSVTKVVSAHQQAGLRATLSSLTPPWAAPRGWRAGGAARCPGTHSDTAASPHHVQGRPVRAAPRDGEGRGRRMSRGHTATEQPHPATGSSVGTDTGRGRRVSRGHTATQQPQPATGRAALRGQLRDCAPPPNLLETPRPLSSSAGRGGVSRVPCPP